MEIAPGSSQPSAQATQVDTDEPPTHSPPTRNSQSETSFEKNEEGQSTNHSNNDAGPQRPITRIRWLLVCLAIFSANVLYGLDNTIVADIQASISEEFNNVNQLGWLGFGFCLGSTIAILPLGKAYAMFDTKWVFIGCLASFAAASALCGAAPSMNAMIVGRVWAGTGGAGMYLGTLNLVTTLSTPKQQPLYVGITGLVYGSGCILGPVVGGAFADSSASWRWGFYINLIIFGAMTPIYLFLLPSLPRWPAMSVMDKLKSLDWFGAVLSSGMYTTFAVAFSFGGAIWAWSDGRVIALIVVSALLAAAFALSQYLAVFTNENDRLFPCEFLRSPQLVLLFVCMSCGGASLFVSIYYIPLYFLFVHGDSGTEAAVRLLPFICLYVVTVVTCGAIMGRTGYHIVWYLLSGIFMTCGGAAMYTVRGNTAAANIYGYTSLVGIGMATTQAGYAISRHLVEPGRVPEVIQFMNISQGASQLLGLTIASSMFQNITFSKLKALLAGTEYTDKEIQAAIAGARSTVLQNATPELRAKCIDAIVQSIGNAWVLVITAGALWTVCSCFLSRKRFL
ncbi:hypothetical protein McanCB56680_005454 [Microsporum canis]